MDESLGESKFRRLTGVVRHIQRVLLIAIPVVGTFFVLEIHTYLRQSVYREQYVGVFLGLVLSSVFLGVCATSGESRQRVPWYDLALASLSLGIGLFVAVIYPQQLLTGLAEAGPVYVVLGTVTILLVIEATRRMSGWVLVVLVAVFILYARFAYLLPAPFYNKGVSWERLSVYLFMDNSALLGLPLWVAGSILFAFIILGELLFTTGGTELLNNLAMSVFGRFRGGPAKMSVVASSMFGTISGSAVANVAATGVVTIPLMKKTGYKPHIAGAIEAAASTGGQIMPPVMGATAFLIAEFLGIPYTEVVIAALVPAILYYLVLFVQVDLEAAKYGFRGLTSGVPLLLATLKGAWRFVIPLIVLVYTLFFLHYQPSRAAIAAAATALVLSYLTKQTRLGPRKLLSVLEGVGRGMLMIGAISALSGLVLGVIFITGFGSVFSLVLLNLGGENLFLILLITAVLCIILGMGLPTAAVYIILAVLIAPALTNLGIVPIAAHLFIFYFGMMSMVTPPICMAAFAGAAIARAGPMQTGFYASRFGLGAYIVPFIFVYVPALLLQGTAVDILRVVLQSLAGLVLISIAFSGFLFRPLSWGKRVLIGVGGLGLLIPGGTAILLPAWLLNIGGLVVSLIILFWEWRGRISVKAEARLA